MSFCRFLPGPFACPRAVIFTTGAALISFAVLAAAPPRAVAQDDPAVEDVAPEESPVEEVTEEEDVAPEDVAPEDTSEEAAPDEEVEEAASEDAASEEAAPEEAKPWDIAAPCENYQHPYEADLCQQWRTAQAAEETAAATKRTVGLARLLMLLGAIAVLLLLLMFIPAVMAALAARRAAQDAGPIAAVPRGDDGGREDEVRAYVDVDKLEFIETPESEGIVKVKVVFRNTGQTPAFKTRSATEVGIRDVADEDMIPTMPLPDRATNAARPRLGRDATAVDIVECDSTPSLADRVMNGDASIVVWGFAEYTDVFARRRKTVFQYLCNADTLDTGQVFKPMVRGDEES